MGRRSIELVKVLVDRIEKNGYQQRAREENAFDLNKRLTEAEGWVAHWKQARQEAHEAGELMRAEIETLKDEIKTLKVESSGLDQTALYAEQDLEKAKAEIETLRKQLTEAQQERVDAIDDYKNQIAAAEALIDPEANGETTIAAMADMILHLRRQLYAGTEPTTVAEPAPCPERESSEEMHDAVPPTWAPVVWDLRRRLRDVGQELGRERLNAEAQGHKLERLSTCVGKVRTATLKYQPWSEALNQITAALAELDAEGGA